MMFSLHIRGLSKMQKMSSEAANPILLTSPLSDWSKTFCDVVQFQLLNIDAEVEDSEVEDSPPSFHLNLTSRQIDASTMELCSNSTSSLFVASFHCSHALSRWRSLIWFVDVVFVVKSAMWIFNFWIQLLHFWQLMLSWHWSRLRVLDVVCHGAVLFDGWREKKQLSGE